MTKDSKTGTLVRRTEQAMARGTLVQDVVLEYCMHMHEAVSLLKNK